MPRPPAAPPLLFASRLLLERGGEELLSPARFDLLRHIDAQGSITAAAQAAGISYRSAWSTVDTLNNLAGVPLVERSKGGAGGGGACLTEAGRQLVETYGRLQERQQQFLDWVAGGGDDMAHYLAMLARIGLRTSARNQLAGVVGGIEGRGPQVRLTVQLSNGQSLAALISEHSRAELGLAEGAPVIALFKASAVCAVTEEQLVRAGSNRLAGRVAALEEGEGRAALALALPGGLTVHALQSTLPAGESLRVGDAAVAAFDPSSVILASGR